MGRGSPSLIASLVRFLSKQIDEHRFRIIVPLESKGALLTDVALGKIDPSLRPRICYLRSLEFLPPDVLANEIFGVFDDCAFSGRTLGRAFDHMKQLGIPDHHIHLMAFFKFQDATSSADELVEVLARTAVPTDSVLLRMSRDEILREVQELAITNKIPASYDNLEWDVSIKASTYSALMQDLARTSTFLNYGFRGQVHASAIVLPHDQRRSVSVPPKIRFWYDQSRDLLRFSPLYFARGERSTPSEEDATLAAMLTPPAPTERQRSFAILQAESLRRQVNLLGYIKPILRQHALTATLSVKQLDRYYGSRSDSVASHISQSFLAVEDRNLPERSSDPKRVDFHWVALEIMRRLGRMYWSQKPPRRGSKGLTVAELLAEFAPSASPEAVHAAIDYCADANLIATFFGGNGRAIFRAFRLTENGEREVGRGDETPRRSLTFVEKLGSLILHKTKSKAASWWVLEKVPAILARRLGYHHPQLEASVGFYGDVMLLRPQETNEYFLTWPQLKTDMWKVETTKIGRRGLHDQRFYLNVERFEEMRQEVLSDPEIVKAIGPIETVLELTASKTRGHHLAIMLDVLSDRSGGATYLACATMRAVQLIQKRQNLGLRSDRQEASKEISKWLAGLKEKSELLTGKRKRVLLEDAERVLARLRKQGRGEVAEQLLSAQPFKDGSGIIESFERLSIYIKRMDVATQMTSASDREQVLGDLCRKLSKHRQSTESNVDNLNTLASAMTRWALALSAEALDPSIYAKARLELPAGTKQRIYIVAYDLVGSTKRAKAGRAGSETDRYIQSVISNWFIAFGGKAQRAEFGGGDLGFGFFDTLEDAIRASLWASHHLDLLKTTNPTLNFEGPHAGFGIVQDEVTAGFQGQAHSSWLSKFAKAWKHEAQTISENAGRNGHPIVAIHADMFSEVQNLPPRWFSRATELDGIPIRFVSDAARPSIPWE